MTRLKDSQSKASGSGELGKFLEEPGKQALVRGILDQLPFWISIKDREGRYRFVNRAMALGHGLQPVDFIGKLTTDTRELRDGGLMAMAQLDRQVLESGLPVERPRYQVTLPDGSLRIRRLFKVPLSNEQGERVGVLSWSEDITEQARAEQARDEQRRLLQSVIDAIPHSIFAKDRNNVATLANRTFLQRWQVRAQDIVGRTDYSMANLRSDRDADLMAGDAKVLATGETVDTELDITVPILGLRSIRMVKAPLRDRDEAITGIVTVGVDITRRVEAERRLMEESALLNAIIAAMPLGLAAKSPDGTILVANEAYSQRWGLPREAVVGRNAYELDFPVEAEREEAMQTDQQVLRQGRILDEELVRTLPDGTVHTFRVIKAPVRKTDGEVLGLVVLGLDVTRRVEAEQHVEEQRALLQSVIDSIPFSLAATGREGQVLLANKAFAGLYDSTPEQMVGQTNPSLLRGSQEQRAFFQKSLDKLFATGIPTDANLRMTVDGNRTRHLRVRRDPLYNLAGELIGVVGVGEDITRRVEAERREKEQQKLLQSVIDAIPHAIYAKQPDGRMVLVNEAFVQRWKMPRDQLVGQVNPTLRFGTEQEVQQILTTDRQVIERGTTIDAESVRTRPDGSTGHVRLIKNPIRNLDGEIAGLVGVGEDITRRVEAERRADEERRRLELSLEASPAAVYLYDSEDRLVLWNQRTTAQFPEMEPHLRQGMTFRELVESAKHLVNTGGLSPEEWVQQRLRDFSQPNSEFDLQTPGGRWLLGMHRRIPEVGTISLTFDQTERKQAELQISRLNNQMMQDLSLAASMQRHLFTPVKDQGTVKVGHVFRPASAVSGDVYFLSTLPDGTVRFFLGDATGHGVAAAFLTTLVYGSLSDLPATASASECMAWLNNQLARHDLEGRFITGVLAAIHPDGRLELANAGHPSPLLLPAGEGAPQMLGESGFALGWFADGEYPPVSTRLQPGGRLLLYTDGLVEWTNAAEEDFGMERLGAALRKHQGQTAQALTENLVGTAEAFTQTTPGDDVSVFCLEYQP